MSHSVTRITVFIRNARVFLFASGDLSAGRYLALAERFLPGVIRKRYCLTATPVAIILGWLQLWSAAPLVTRRRAGQAIAILLALLIFRLTPLFTNVALASEPAAASYSPTQLVIPSIALNEMIVPVGYKQVVVNGIIYGQWLAAENRVGWHNLSALPGQSGNTVLNGHSDIYGQVFRHLENINLGDEIAVFNGGRTHRYVVTRKISVQEAGASVQQRIENARLIMPTADERLTLITCTRPGATHRLIVTAHPVKN